MRAFNKFLMAALCTTAMTTPAFAQDEAQEVEAFDDNVIIVTATRRAEDVQDIPIAVTAVSPAQLEQQGVVNVQNIGSVSSSFSTSNAQTASGTVVLRIRGVGTTSNNIGFESAVGIFVDGAYQSRPGVALGEFVDVERVEVLRGPQGTLFGRNTSAGALNITNVRPDLNDFGGFVNATYGNFDHMSLQGAINAPLIEDTLALRVTGAYRKRDGYVDIIDSAGNSVGDSNDTDQYLLRGQLGFETPGGISGRLIADYSKSTASCCAAIEVLHLRLKQLVSLAL
ncbi:TonB-dependent receptor plug domain-containing protein [Parasphingorhabdus flavimaris]|uniref:TonB-dependent receptor plug domain-containing protein n=1 Tax=Parasphingorhabdus flavimaris TaxID=266812 RepID=UPI001FEA8F46|nr:TonB-dependent receptor [Parasphingorhabdus flavimaris]